MRKYAVYNARTGKNEQFNTKEEALLCFWSNVIIFAKSHFHGVAYSTIDVDVETGDETWYVEDDASKIMDKPLTPEEIELVVKQAAEFVESLTPTPVEVLP